MVESLATGDASNLTGKLHTEELAKLTEGCETLFSCAPLARKPPTDHHTIEEEKHLNKEDKPLFYAVSLQHLLLTNLNIMPNDNKEVF